MPDGRFASPARRCRTCSCWSVGGASSSETSPQGLDCKASSGPGRDWQQQRWHSAQHRFSPQLNVWAVAQDNARLVGRSKVKSSSMECTAVHTHSFVRDFLVTSFYELPAGGTGQKNCWEKLTSNRCRKDWASRGGKKAKRFCFQLLDFSHFQCRFKTVRWLNKSDKLVVMQRHKSSLLLPSTSLLFF